MKERELVEKGGQPLLKEISCSILGEKKIVQIPYDA